MEGRGRIIMAKYQLTENEYIINKSDGGFIPIDENNLDYKKYLEWVAEGNTPDPIVGPTKQEQILIIQQQAYEDIVAIAPEYKQRNMIARAAELLNKKIDGALSTNEQFELDSMQATWDQIKTIRDQSNIDIENLE